MSDDDVNKKPPISPEGDHLSFDDDDPDAPPSAEEVAASQRLRDALALKEAGGSLDRGGFEDFAIVDSLRAAWSPSALHEGVHAEMLDDLPTEEELVLAASLRESLETASSSSSSLSSLSGSDALVASLKAAWNPQPISDAEHEAILLRVVGAREGKVVQFRPRPAARTMRVVAITTTTMLAIAASVVLWMNGSSPRGTTEAPVATNLAKARSTQPLFGEPFKAGETTTTSARIDKIALARASDYRDNRFAKWGVR